MGCWSEKGVKGDHTRDVKRDETWPVCVGFGSIVDNENERGHHRQRSDCPPLTPQRGCPS
jgi:hypothetical protein